MNWIFGNVRAAGVFGASVLWLMLVLTVLAGCVAGAVVPREGFDPPFSEAKLEPFLGVKIDTVKQELGQPAYELYGDGKRYFVYQGSIDTAGMLVGIPTIPIWDETIVCSVLEFGPDQRLKRYQTRGGGKLMIDFAVFGDFPEDCRYAFWSRDEVWTLKKSTYAVRVREAQSNAEECLKALRTGIQDCDAEALYDGSRGMSLLDSWLSGCLAAHFGYPKARNSMGIYYRWGAAPVTKDLTKSYLWFSLAEKEGVTSAISYRDEVESEMTPAQIAEAERLVAEWEPNPAECEVYSDAANAP